MIGSGTAELEVDGHITASGNISASGDTHRFGGKIEVDTKVMTDTIEELTDNAGITFGNNITASGDISASGTIISNELETQYRHFDTGSVPLGSVGGSVGDIVKFGGTTTVPGAIYQLQGGGTWALTDADAAASATGSIAVAVGTNATTNGMLLRGMAKLNHDPGGSIGTPIYLAVAAGSSSNAAPTGNNDIARIIGYNIDTSGKIYFNPDNTFVEVSA